MLAVWSLWLLSWLLDGIWVSGTRKSRGLGMHWKLSSFMDRRPVAVAVWK